jgi:hypothetical protein
MKVKLTDQLHISEVSADTLPGGSVIDVSDSTAKDLVARGLATKVAAAPKNKMAAAPANKGRGRRK